MDRRINLLAVAWCINAFACSIAYPFLPFYLHSTRGFPIPQVGLMYRLMGLSRTLAPPVSSPLVDLFRRRFMLVYFFQKASEACVTNITPRVIREEGGKIIALDG